MSTHAISRDAECIAQIREHHEELGAALEALALRLDDAEDAVAAQAARDDLVRWARVELGSYADGEESTLHRAVRRVKAAQPLLEALEAEHRLIADLIDEVEAAENQDAAAAWAGALLRAYEYHAATDDGVLLPMLVADPTIDVASLLYRLDDLTA
jgi:hypothetical protein